MELWKSLKTSILSVVTRFILTKQEY